MSFVEKKYRKNSERKRCFTSHFHHQLKKTQVPDNVRDLCAFDQKLILNPTKRR